MNERVRASMARRITAILFIAQGLGSAGYIAAATINPIVGASLSGQMAWAGAPSAVLLLGSALAALAWGYTMDIMGRRGMLVLGLTLGILGFGVVVGTIHLSSWWLFLAALALVGAANGALQLGRFAAAEVHMPAERGRAIANVVLGGTIGAVLGPLLVGPASRLALANGWQELSGPYVGSIGLLALAAAVVYIGLRPDPRDIARDLVRFQPEATPIKARPLPQILTQPGVIMAVAAMVFGQVVMVMLMVITALHMKIHHHSLTNVSLVIASHTFGMYAFSLLSGQLTDRWGRGPVIMTGAATLILASLAAPLSPHLLPLAVALFLLGFGWNLCYVGGSSLLSDQLAPVERARVQGFNDLLIGLASALASLGSGVVFAAVGYEVMGMLGALAGGVPLGMAVWWHRSRLALAPQR